MKSLRVLQSILDKDSTITRYGDDSKQTANVSTYSMKKVRTSSAQTAMLLSERTNESMNTVEDEKIHAVLCEADISPAEDSEINLYNSPAPLDKNLMQEAEPDVRAAGGSKADLITKQSLADRNIEPDTVLHNIYEDSIRGNVILNPLYDCSYQRPTYRPELISKINDPDESVNNIPQWCFTWSEGVRSMLTNPFKGLKLEGATIAFWMRVPSYFTLVNHSAILTFLGDLKHYKHPDPNVETNSSNDAITTPFLTIEASGDVYFQEAYMNILAQTINGAATTYSQNIPPYRKSLGRRWEYIVFSITNEGIETYINGVKVNYDMVYKGKRFNGGNGNPGNAGMSTLMDFISDEDTNLYLGLTILNGEGKSDQIMYDNVTFYDEAVNEEEALQLFHDEIESFKEKQSNS